LNTLDSGFIVRYAVPFGGVPLAPFWVPAMKTLI